MKQGNGSNAAMIAAPPEYWSLLQETLLLAIGRCNDIASQVEAHQRLGRYGAEQLLDRINGQVREMRNLLEAVEVPF